MSVSKSRENYRQIYEKSKEGKDRDKSKQIQAQRAKVSQKLLIGRSMKDSNLEVSGLEVQGKKSRTEVAKAIGRVSTHGDKRRRLLSIVAWTFSQSVLQSYFSSSKSTITAARVHAILFGRGGVPQDGLHFTRQAFSPEVIPSPGWNIPSIILQECSRGWKGNWCSIRQ